jgi:endoglucanase
MPVPEVLRKLLTAPGPSGYEQAAAAVFRDAAAAFAEVSHDTVGSTVARVKGTAGGPLLAVIGHIDEIGLLVSHINEKGFLHVVGTGGWDPQVLVGQRVEVLTRSGAILGVVGRKPVHVLESEERKKAVELKGLHVDIGAKDGEEARSLVREGDAIVVAAEPVELRGDRLVSRSLDNRLGVYVALEVARRVSDSGGGVGPVAGVAAVQEEIGSHGARSMAYGLEPDLAVVVDVTHATDAPGIDVNELGSHSLGSGPVIERGANLNPRVTDLLHDAGEAAGIPFTLAASGRHTGTDVDAMHLSRGGVPCGLIGLPLRYMHSPVEMVDLADIDAAARLIAAAAQRVAPDATFTR